MQTLVARTLHDANGAEMTVNEIAAHLRGVGFHVNLNSLHQALFQLSKRSAIRKNGVRKGVRYSW
jgi:hypothetical protein